jgi:deoxyribodipyrimidine photo-lyase
MRTRSVVVWFRRDLRLHDHPALGAALADGDRMAALFVLDERLLGGRWPAPNRTWFMLESVRELAAALAARGSRLHVRLGIPEQVVPAFAREAGAVIVHVTGDHAPYGRERDRRVGERLLADGRELRHHAGHLVHEPDAIVRPDGSGYSVYSPFRRTWDRLSVRPLVPAPDVLPSPPDDLDPGVLPGSGGPGGEPPTAATALLPLPGEAAARARLHRWLESGIEDYDRTRDVPGIEGGTSRLSQDLHFGLLSAAEVASRAAGPGEGRRRYLAELAWRDFYAHLLYRQPRLRRQSYRLDFDQVGAAALPGRPALEPSLVEAWQDGRTGYPFVDAGMRQLRAMGWMHNRVRMVAASFLVKHLLVDWRTGEAHFMRHLVDGDVASNNGGWQWAASVGTDPQPYFRVFNPVLQGERFDADGRYVRRWVPELAAVPDPFLHAPWRMPTHVQAQAGCRIGQDYPAPIVEHGEARARALEAYRAARTTL